jgi:phosphoglycerol transferase MdoB-like AlkP superfamily enzyme
VDQYLSCVRESDAALEELISELKEREEPTLLLIFGDHQPQVNTSFYEAALGKSLDELTTAEEQTRHLTPFLIWANYDIEEQEGVVLSINYLSSLLMETANLPLTGYQQFLAQLREQVPVINAVGYREAGGEDTADRDDLSEAAQAAVLQYEQLQYNQIFDRSERVDSFFFVSSE